MIMHVVVTQAPTRTTALIAYRLLRFANNEAAQKSDLVPGAFTYNMLLKAWEESGLPEAPHRLEGQLQGLRNQDIAPDLVSYHIPRRF